MARLYNLGHFRMADRLILFLSFGFLVSCSPGPLTAEMSLYKLKAVNLEETVSRKDELMMAWSMTAFDSRNRLVGVVNGAWGVEPVKRGAEILFSPPQVTQLVMPKNGKIVTSLVLIEVDDYNRAQTFINRVRDVNRWVQVPVGFFELGAELLTPLKFVTVGLAAAGIGVNLADRLDDDDILGQSSFEWKDVDARRSRQPTMRIPARFSGTHLRDSFDYLVEYDINLKRVRIRPADRK